MHNQNLTWSNADLIKVAQVYNLGLLDAKSTRNPRENRNINIPASDFKLILEDIGTHRHRLNNKQKQFAFTFIKSIMNKPSITHKQCKVLRDIQKQCSLNYLKSPKLWK